MSEINNEENVNQEIDNEEINDDEVTDSVFIETQVTEYNVDQIINVLSFFLGVFTNWGSLNILGMMVGFNYKLLVSKKFYIDFIDSLNNAIPSFVLGVFLVNVYIPYFIVSMLLGLSAQRYKAQLRKYYLDMSSNNFSEVKLVINNNRHLLQNFMSSFEKEE